jgi:histidinol dehydrogenase
MYTKDMIANTLKSALQTESQETSSPAPVIETVKSIIADIRSNGDRAVRNYSEKFDKWSPASFRLSQSDIDKCITACSTQTIEDIKTVQQNVRRFAEAQRSSLTDFEIESQPGVFLGQKNVPISKVGCYIPGGKYPLLASAHMTILTAKVAGVSKVIACTPPIQGKIPNASIAAMYYAGADEIYLLGGIQAIVAMACGTESIDRVDFLAGPGNAYVAEAKRQLFGQVGIDLFAGPTEVLIVADETADPAVVACDLLSQAEHGPDTPAVLISTSEEVALLTLQHIDRQLKTLCTADIAAKSWRDHGEIHVVKTIDDAYQLADIYASEHVQVLTKDPKEALNKMSNYGALFLGEKTCVSYGDKVIGTNHVLPTRKAARFTGGLWVGKYLKTCTYQYVEDASASAELGRLCGRAARAENFEGHARSGDIRAHLHGGDRFDWIG